MDDEERSMQIQIAREAIAGTPKNDPIKRAVRMEILATQLEDRYSIAGVMSDLEEAIALVREAHSLVPRDHSNRPIYLMSLTNLLLSRHEGTGNVENLEEALEIALETLGLTPDDHPRLSSRYYNIGVCFTARYEITQELEDLEKAIHYANKATDATPKDNLNRGRRLYSLSRALGYRYSRTESMVDLENAIQVARESLSANAQELSNREEWLTYLGIHPADPDQARKRNNLASRLLERSARTTGNLADVSEAIMLYQEAVKLTPENHPDKGKYLQNLGLGFTHKFLDTMSLDDLEEGIQAYRQALKAYTPDHPDRAVPLQALGRLLQDRYVAKIAGPEEAILVRQRNSINATALGLPMVDTYPSIFLQGGHKRIPVPGVSDDLDEAIGCQELALQHGHGPIAYRIAAGRALVESCAIASDWERAFRGAMLAMKLIPKLTPRSLNNADKQNLLRRVSGLACDTAAAALNAGKRPLVALNILEQGRGIIAASLEDPRADLSRLEEDYPELAREFRRLQGRLEPKVPQIAPLLNQVQTLSIQDQSRRFIGADQELDTLIRDIRTRPGYSEFLLPTDEEEIRSAADRGPIIVINATEYRCDALLVERSQVRALALPQLSRYDIEEHAQNRVIGSTEVLSWLWNTVAHPVLQELGFSKTPSDGSWPRVWWVLTGVLSKFPMHAAGLHVEKKGETVLDRVMSSYSSSVKAIINGRRHRAQHVRPGTPESVVLVAMQNTPGHSRLHHAVQEISIVHKICKSMGYRPVEAKPQKKDVIAHLLDCSVFHFAGHGHTDEADPSASGLLLQDWRQDKLTVANLLEMNLREQGPFLAYLSACGTGEIKDDRYFDENIHLISACQLAGFRHVIGTLWEVNDQSCVDMARVTYEVIKDEGMSDEVICKALHMATKQNRDTMILTPGKRRRSRRVAAKESRKRTKTAVRSDGRNRRDTRISRKMVLDDSDEEDERLFYWVPYVHYGV